MDEVAISVEGVSVRFRSRRATVDALAGVDLAVKHGEIVGLLGPNGSGKTTLLRVLSGEQTSTSGRSQVLNAPPGARENAIRVGVQPDAKLPFGHLGGAEFLGYIAALQGLQPTYARARTTLLLERLELAHAARRPVRTYSTGMARRLAFAAAILTEPSVLLLDEPTAGLDAIGSLLVCDMLRELATSGCAVLIASHHLQEVEVICDRIYLLHRGQVATQGTLDEVLGTTAHELVVRGIDDASRSRITTAIGDAGGEVVHWRPARRHLFELFRELDTRA